MFTWALTTTDVYGNFVRSPVLECDLLRFLNVFVEIDKPILKEPTVIVFESYVFQSDKENDETRAR